MWHKNYPVAQGDRQSPIDIVPNQTSHDPSLGPVVLNYDHCTSIKIANNGHSVVVDFEDSDDRSGETNLVSNNYFSLLRKQKSHLQNATNPLQCTLLLELHAQSPEVTLGSECGEQIK